MMDPWMISMISMMDPWIHHADHADHPRIHHAEQFLVCMASENLGFDYFAKLFRSVQVVSCLGLPQQQEPYFEN